MRYFPAAFETLTEQFARLPGIGSKTAQRLAFHVLSLPDDAAAEFASAILQAKKTIHTCPVCQNLTDRAGVQHLQRPAAGPRADLRCGRAQGCHRHGADPGVSRACTMCCTA